MTKTGVRVRRILLASAMVSGLTMASATFAVAAPSAPAVSTSSIPGCHGNYPEAYAQFWRRMPWPITGKNNGNFHVKSPTNRKWVWISGGETYDNRSSPKLPDGTYNSYDTQFRPTNKGSSRGSGRFVRERANHKLYYTANHYQSWCYVGTQYK
jgi:ribonuclease